MKFQANTLIPRATAFESGVAPSVARRSAAAACTVAGLLAVMPSAPAFAQADSVSSRNMVEARRASVTPNGGVTSITQVVRNQVLPDPGVNTPNYLNSSGAWLQVTITPSTGQGTVGYAQSRGWVDGVLVAVSRDSGSTQGGATLSFMVPPGSTWAVGTTAGPHLLNVVAFGAIEPSTAGLTGFRTQYTISSCYLAPYNPTPYVFGEVLVLDSTGQVVQRMTLGDPWGVEGAPYVAAYGPLPADCPSRPAVLPQADST